MLKFEIMRYLKRNRIRLLIISFLLVITAMFSVNNVYRFLILSELLTESDVYTISDYIIGTLNSTQFVMYFIIPVLFSVLVADLIRVDFDGKLDQFLFTRLNNRLSYLSSKLKMIALLSVFFTIWFLIILLIVGLFYQISLVGSNYHYLFLANQRHAIWVWISVVNSFVLGMILVGMIVVMLSVYLQNAGVPVAIIILLGFVHNFAYVLRWDTALAWLPFTQYIFGQRYYFAPFGLSVPYFTTVFSTSYMIIGIAILFCLTLKRINIMEIGSGKER